MSRTMWVALVLLFCGLGELAADRYTELQSAIKYKDDKKARLLIQGMVLDEDQRGLSMSNAYLTPAYLPEAFVADVLLRFVETRVAQARAEGRKPLFGQVKAKSPNPAKSGTWQWFVYDYRQALVELAAAKDPAVQRELRARLARDDTGFMALLPGLAEAERLEAALAMAEAFPAGSLPALDDPYSLPDRLDELFADKAKRVVASILAGHLVPFPSKLPSVLARAAWIREVEALNDWFAGIQPAGRWFKQQSPEGQKASLAEKARIASIVNATTVVAPVALALGVFDEADGSYSLGVTVPELHPSWKPWADGPALSPGRARLAGLDLRVAVPRSGAAAFSKGTFPGLRGKALLRAGLSGLFELVELRIEDIDGKAVLGSLAFRARLVVGSRNPGSILVENFTPGSSLAVARYEVGPPAIAASGRDVRMLVPVSLPGRWAVARAEEPDKPLWKRDLGDDFEGVIPAIRVEGGTYERFVRGLKALDERSALVTVSSFIMGRTEVTQAQWLAVAEKNPSRFSGLDLPAEAMGWMGAVEWCNALSLFEGLEPAYTFSGAGSSRRAETDFSKNGWRLPTVAEWEYAARGGKASRGYLLAGSDDPGLVAWYSGNSDKAPHPVAAKLPNELGFYDLSGNVAEYCDDLADLREYPLVLLVDPRGPISGLEYDMGHAMRGGSWALMDEYLLPGRRENENYALSGDYGFRVVRAAP